jgi:hypothetical protein
VAAFGRHCGCLRAIKKLNDRRNLFDSDQNIKP